MSLLGGLGGIIGGVVGLATGGVSGAITGFQHGETLFGGGGGSNLPALPGGGGSGGLFGGGGPLPGLFGPGGSVTRALDPQGNITPNGGAPRGYHLNKHALAPSKRHGAVPAHSIYVRNRSLNPLNPRALSRALKREKRARKIIAKLHVFKHQSTSSRRSGHRAGCGCVVCRRK